MENINNTNTETKPLKASDKTIKFLTDFSKAYTVVKSRGLVFERNLN
jgi:hypothetical protein